MQRIEPVESAGLAERIAGVRATIAAAAERVGRRSSDVTLVAVSKTVDAERVAAAVGCGLTHFGENRIQEARDKLAEIEQHLSPEDRARLTWDLVGHLQTNKAALAVTLFSRIESVDSVRLAEALSRLGDRRGARVRVLLEVNVGGEASKSGFSPDALREAFPGLSYLPGLAIGGLMTVAPLVAEPELARPYFRALRDLRDSIVRAHPGFELPDLSMGMTGDYPIAIEEGATIVRVGRAIFGERPPG